MNPEPVRDQNGRWIGIRISPTEVMDVDAFWIEFENLPRYKHQATVWEQKCHQLEREIAEKEAARDRAVRCAANASAENWELKQEIARLRAQLHAQQADVWAE